MPTMRDELNKSSPNRLDVIFSKIKFGELLNRIMGGGSTNVPADEATANAATQTGAYVQADVQTIATLANALKTKVNAILAALRLVGGATEQAVTVTSNVATLASTPSTLLIANATSAGSTGMKEILTGPITGQSAVIPKTGQCTWDGGVKVLFAVGDAVTAADFMYAKAGDATVSALRGSVEP